MEESGTNEILKHEESGNVEELNKMAENAMQVFDYDTLNVVKAALTRMEAHATALTQDSPKDVNKITDMGGSPQKLDEKTEQVDSQIQAVEKEAEAKIAALEEPAATTPAPAEKKKSPLGLTQESIDIMNSKLPERLANAKAGKLGYSDAESLGKTLALNGNVQEIENIINAPSSIGDLEKNKFAQGALELFADAGNPAEAEKLLNYLVKQDQFKPEAGDAPNRENMFTGKTTNMERVIAQSYIDAGDIEGAKRIAGRMIKGIDRQTMEKRIKEAEGSNEKKSHANPELELAKKNLEEINEKIKKLHLKQFELNNYDSNLEFAKQKLSKVAEYEAKYKDLLAKEITTYPNTEKHTDERISFKGMSESENRNLIYKNNLSELIVDVLGAYNFDEGRNENPQTIFTAQKETTLGNLLADYKKFLENQTTLPKPTQAEIKANQEEVNTAWKWREENQKEVQRLESKEQKA